MAKFTYEEHQKRMREKLTPPTQGGLPSIDIQRFRDIVATRGTKTPVVKPKKLPFGVR